MTAQGEQESHAREGKAHEERREEREVEAQEGHDGEEEMTTLENCVEDKKETNSLREEHDVSNRHMTWWRGVWWVRVDNGPHLRRRETVEERGEQPRGQREKHTRPNRSQGKKWRKKRDKTKRNCAVKTLCT